MALKNDWKLNDTVMPEHMNDIAIEAESLQNQINQHTTDINELTNRVGDVETDVNDLTGRVSANEQNITNLTNRVGSVETDVTNVTNRVGEIEGNYLDKRVGGTIDGRLTVSRDVTLRNTLNVMGLSTLGQLQAGQTTIRAGQNALGIVGSNPYFSMYPRNDGTLGSWIGHQSNSSVWTEILNIVGELGAVWIRGNGGVKLAGGNIHLDGNDLATVRNIFMTGTINPFSNEEVEFSDEKLDLTSFFDSIDFMIRNQAYLSIEDNMMSETDLDNFNKTIHLNLQGIDENFRKYACGIVVENNEVMEQINITNLLMMSMAQIKSLQQEIKELKKVTQ